MSKHEEDSVFQRKTNRWRENKGGREKCSEQRTSNQHHFEGFSFEATESLCLILKEAWQKCSIHIEYLWTARAERQNPLHQMRFSSYFFLNIANQIDSTLLSNENIDSLDRDNEVRVRVRMKTMSRRQREELMDVVQGCILDKHICALQVKWKWKINSYSKRPI